MKTLLKTLCLLVVCLFHHSVLSQNFEWLNSYKSKKSVGYCTIEGVSADGVGNSVFLISQKSDQIDSIIFGQFTFIKLLEKQHCFLVKLDSTGTVVNAKSVGTFNAHSMCGDKTGFIYITGYLTDTNIVGKDTLYSNNGSIFFAKFDDKMNLVWAKQTGNSSPFFKDINLTYSKAQIVCNSGRIYFLTMTNKSANIDDSVYNLQGDRTFIYGELDVRTGKFLWSNFLYDKYQTTFVLSGITRLKESLFLSGHFSGNPKYESILVGKDTVISGAFIVKTDSIGKPLQTFNLFNKKGVIIRCLSTDGVNLYFGGGFRDTLKWGNKTIIPEYPSSNANIYSYFEFMAGSLTATFQTRWLYRPKVISKSENGMSELLNVITDNEFMYFGGYVFNAEILIDSNVIGRNHSKGWHELFLLKFDSLGNVLWATYGKGRNPLIDAIDIIKNRSVFIGGAYFGDIELGMFKDSSYSQGYKAWLTKITDYDITRGKVSVGPYCAGDTIKVPYTHIGTFDTSNYFIAELSDEKGNFEGGQRELGRIKTNLDSVVPGILPLFQISSSPHYRIRVRSTAPAIQSYYILDTLRLLIYSKDKADPGPPETICYRDTFKLNTFGGTKWTWRPKYMMDDSSLRQPLIWPDTTSVYQIIIGDSSGCGTPDTAFKTIYVKPRPKLVGDTLYNKCEGKDLMLKFTTQYTDSNGFRIRWYQNNKLQFSKDSILNYGDDAANLFKVVLTDNCSPSKDSVYVRVNYFGPLKVVLPKDTTICFGDEILLTVKGSGGIAAQHVFNWYDTKGKLVGSGSPKVTLTKSDTFKVVLIDGCSINSDSSIQIVSVSKKINNQAAMGLPNDTIYCGSFSTTLKIKNTDQDDQYNWVDLTDQVSVGTADSIKWAKVGSLEATVTNSCGTTKDTITIKQLSKPKITLDTLYDACENISLKLDISNSKNEETYLWSTAETTPTITTTKAGNYWATAMNYCGTDSVNFKVVLYPKPNPNFTVADVCEGELVNFQNKTAGGKTFEWRFGDGTISTDSVPNKTYAINQNSRTYFVTLVAKISKGCQDSISKPLNVNATPDAGFNHTSQGKTVFFNQNNSEIGESYRWYFGDGDSSTLQNPTHQYAGISGSFYVCLNILNAANCRSKFCDSVRFNVGINDVRKNLFTVYPNPTEGTIQIKFETFVSGVQISVFNLLGEMVFSVPDFNGNELNLNLGQFCEGIYQIKVANRVRSSVQKIVLMK